MPRPSAVPRPTLGANALLLLTVLFIVVALNARLWRIVFNAPGLDGLRGIGVIAAVAAALFALTLLMLLPLSLRWTFRPGLTLVLMLAAGATYFIGDFGAVIDRHALASVYETDVREAGEWLNARMLLTIAGLGLLPAMLLWWVKIDWRSPLRELWSRLKLAALAFALLGIAAAGFGKDVASLLRNHMELRHIANPFALLAAQLSYMDHARDDNRPLQAIGLDARRGPALKAGDRPVVLVLAIGESARASSYSLNGYDRPTDARMRALGVLNFSNVASCGTNTATSLPCMFTDLGRRDYEDGVAKYRENVLDVLMRGGYDVLWLDNNTGSKSLAKRAKEVRAGREADPTLCNEEGCHDQVLVEQLRATLPTIRRDTVVVLHLLGSHGPAYYARYPKAFAKFTPECRSNQLQQCSDLQLRNTYDNTILYTDHILASAAELLRDDPRIDPALLYVSDHGESLGEHGLYLHGAPYAMAPDEQTHVPMQLWAPERFAARRGLDLPCLRGRDKRPLSHDHVFHSVLGLADVTTAVRKPALDLFDGCTTPDATR
ncbi:phosphoethanolamine--lipid A transferase [Lysobacter hankyongensis]|uniref:Phosphoethanolamine--lipid A transferase n=1 Tax=Lysobacter hankyongensis TaxID=1176535 RepID=A0ABP9B6E6_9GAMM